MLRHLQLLAGIALLGIYGTHLVYPPSLTWLLEHLPVPLYLSVGLIIVLWIAAGLALLRIVLEAFREDVMPTTVIWIGAVIFGICFLVTGFNLIAQGQLNDHVAVLDANVRVGNCTFALIGAFFLIEEWWDSRR